SQVSPESTRVSMIRIKPKPEDYTLKNPDQIERSMCANCGLVFDFQFPGLEYGWPEEEPIGGGSHDPETGEFEDVETRFICPRCRISLEEKLLVPISLERL